MIISVINHTNGLLNDADVQAAIRAVNRQLAEDFDSNWGMTAVLRLEGDGNSPGAPEALRFSGEAVLYLWHPVDVPSALGYHGRNHLGVPYGFVFPGVARQMGEPWTASMSHEAMEMVADPEVNLMVMGPHPADRSRMVFHWYEVCDAVQGETYEIDGVPVSNFLLPLYFTNTEETGSRNDFLRVSYNGSTLRSFGVNPGGFVGYYDPLTGDHHKFTAEGDLIALQRMAIKEQLGLARRSERYRFQTWANKPVTAGLRQFL
jgi:hypothetical protein